MIMKPRSIILIVMGLLLSSAFVAQLGGLERKRKHFRAPEATDLLPKALDGWVVQDKAIAETPEMQEAVKEALNYDSAVFRIYQRGNVEISVYLAYWLPGSISPQQVDGHTPDICWVQNGWSMKKLPPLPPKAVGEYFLPLENMRRFEIQGHQLSVLFWHFNGSHYRSSLSVFEQGLGTVDRARRRISQVWSAVTTQAEQQLFIRVSSTGDISKELDEAPLAACSNLMARVLGGEVLYTIK